MMFVREVNKATAASATKEKKKLSLTSGSFSELLEETDTINSSASLMTTPALNPFLAIQEIIDKPSSSAAQAKDKATKVLKELEKLRVALLGGKVPLEVIRNLHTFSDPSWNSFPDPKLRSILQEIRTRAAVEMAKLERRS